jgi:hypothetical protein
MAVSALSVQVTSCSLSNNSAAEHGGGLLLHAVGVAMLLDALVQGNEVRSGNRMSRV